MPRLIQSRKWTSTGINWSQSAINGPRGLLRHCEGEPALPRSAPICAPRAHARHITTQLHLHASAPRHVAQLSSSLRAQRHVKETERRWREVTRSQLELTATSTCTRALVSSYSPSHERVTCICLLFNRARFRCLFPSSPQAN